MIQRIERVKLPLHGDDRGQLVAIEGFCLCGGGYIAPFEIKRCYYIFDTTPGTVRGHHAHQQLKQLLVCVSGACTIRCDFGDGRVEDVVLDWPDQGLLIEGLVWHDMLHFSKGAVLMVLASDHYDEADYVRDYDTFLQLAKAFSEEA